MIVAVHVSGRVVLAEDVNERGPGGAAAGVGAAEVPGAVVKCAEGAGIVTVC